MSAAQIAQGLRLSVRVPASSANLGPGFDSIGLALGVWDECQLTTTSEPGLRISVMGEGAGAVPLDATHLVHRTMQTAWRELGVQPPTGLQIECVNAVPHGRGMGSSATAIVTGIVAAQGLLAASDPSRPVDPDFTNDLANRLEGHPDNASASVFGGLVLSWSDQPGVVGTTRTARIGLHPDLDVVVYVPAVQLSTAKARSVLPAQVRLGDAASNSARAGLLIHACSADPSLLVPATRDWLHQEARRGSYANSMRLVDRLRAAGHAATISGAGPSVLVLTTTSQRAAAASFGDDGWRVLQPGIAHRGAHVLPTT